MYPVFCVGWLCTVPVCLSLLTLVQHFVSTIFFFVRNIFASRGNSVGIVTRLWFGRPGPRIHFFALQQRPERLWGPLLLLFVAGWRNPTTQLYADIYLLINYCTFFGRPSRPSSGVHKTVGAASGTDHTIWGACFIRTYLVTFEEACSPDSMICTRGCNYCFMCSWCWARWTPETCRVI